MHMEKVGDVISKHPRSIIVAILVLTIFFGYFASAVEVNTDYRTFLPKNSKEVDSYFEVIDEYGNIEYMQVLVESSDNEKDILTQSAFSEMLGVEDSIVNDQKLNSTLLKSSQLPYGLLSIADIITQTVFTQQLNVELGKIMKGMNNTTMIDQKMLMDEITRSVMSLTFRDKLTILEGGYVDTQLLNRDLRLNFTGLNDTAIKSTVFWLMTNNSVSGQLKSMICSILSNDFDKNSSSPSAKATYITVQLNGSLPRETIEECELKVVDIMDTHEKSTKMSAMALGLIDHALMDLTKDTVLTVIPIALVLVTIILLIIYRTISDTIICLFGLAIAAVWMLGIGNLLGLSFNEITVVTPALLIGLGIDYSMHLILRYREELREGHSTGDSSKLSITFVGSAILLTTVTTMVGFSSNISSPLPPIVDFGILASIGIASAFIVMTTLVPSVRMLLDNYRKKMGKPVIGEPDGAEKTSGKNIKNDNRKKRAKLPIDRIVAQWHEVKGSGIRLLNKAFDRGAHVAEHHSRLTIAIVLIITALSLLGASQVETKYDQKEFLPDNIDLTYATKYLDDHFQTGMTKLGIVLIKGNVTNPEIIKAMNEAIDKMKDDEYIVAVRGIPQTQSVFTLMAQYAETNQTFAAMCLNADMNNDGLPDKNFTMLFEWLYDNTDDGKLFLHKTEDRFDGTVIRVQTKAGATNIEQERLYNDLKTDVKPLRDLEKDDEINDIAFTGIPILAGIITSDLQKSLSGSIAITFTICSIMLMVMFWITRRSWGLGFVTALPTVFVLIVGLGTMHLLGISINPMTALIGSLTIGLGIDYSIHITHRFLEEIDRFGDIDKASKYAMSHTGTALFGATVTTIAAFGAIMFSDLVPLRQFSFLMMLAIFYSLIASVFILPVFLVRGAKWKANQIKKKRGKNSDELNKKD